MPFISSAQQRWGNSPAGVKALGGPAKVAEWNSASKGMKLPKRIHKAAKPKPKGAGHYMSTFGALAPSDGEDGNV